MALRAVTEHPKFAHLKLLLGAKKLVAVGALETMWHFCGKFTPRGDIGKYSVEQIEAWCEWEGSPGALVRALVEAGWVDRHPGLGLLVVHDWHRHCDDATKLAVKRANADFVTYRNADGTYTGGNAQIGHTEGASSGQSADPVGTESERCRDTVGTEWRLPGAGAGAGAEPVPGAGAGPESREPWRGRIPGQWVLLGRLVDSEPVIVAIEEFERHLTRINAPSYDPSRIEALGSFVAETNPSPEEFAAYVRHCFRDKGWRSLPPDRLPKWLDTHRKENPPGTCNPEGNPTPEEIEERTRIRREKLLR